METIKKMKKIGAVALFLTVLLKLTLALPPEALAATEGDFKYEIILGKATITKYKGKASEVRIPDTLGGKPVTAIGDYVFSDFKKMKSVTIPDSVTSIGSGAFVYCDKLTSISIPEGVKSIGESAFAYCNKLQRVTIPDGVTFIDDTAFYSCESLIEFSVGENNKKYSSEDGVLFDKRKTTLIQYPTKKSGKYAIPNSVTKIGGSAFHGCKMLTAVTIPDSVKSIGNGAFYDCNKLTKVTIPNRVTSIGYQVFTSCSKLTNISVVASNKRYSSRDGVLFNKDKTTLIKYPGNKSGKYTIPNSVTRIGNGAFQECEKLTGVVIPNRVKSIGESAFDWCTKLTNITIPNSVDKIGDHAFRYCERLKRMNIEDGVKTIGFAVFEECTTLYNVSIPNSVTKISDNAFEDCKKLTIFGKKDSYAQKYAEKNKIYFVVK